MKLLLLVASQEYNTSILKDVALQVQKCMFKTTTIYFTVINK